MTDERLAEIEERSRLLLSANPADWQAFDEHISNDLADLLAEVKRLHGMVVIDPATADTMKALNLHLDPPRWVPLSGRGITHE